jgi:hypothetical protein
MEVILVSPDFFLSSKTDEFEEREIGDLPKRLAVRSVNYLDLTTQNQSGS